MPVTSTWPKDIGRVLGSQIYIGTNPDDISHDTPYALRDVFINTESGYVYQYNGTEWEYVYSLVLNTEGYAKCVNTTEEALTFDAGTTVIIAPIDGIARIVRVVSDQSGEKSLVDIYMGDGTLPFITKVVNDLVNYYNKDEVDSKIGSLKLIEFRKVESLPQVGESNVIYLVPHQHGQGDYYDEYCWVADEQKFEKIGNTDALTNYYTKDEVDALFAQKADKAAFKSHVNDYSNPHNVTKEQVGLGNVNNTSDIDKPISTMQQAALDLKADKFNIYTKAESDALLAQKAVKSEVEAALATKANSADVYKKAEVYTKDEVDDEISSAVSSTYRYKGTVETYSQLPLSGMLVGDVYNVEEADPTHAVSAGDNVAWNGMTWDVLSGMVDLSNYYTKQESDELLDGVWEGVEGLQLALNRKVEMDVSELQDECLAFYTPMEIGQ